MYFQAFFGSQNQVSEPSPAIPGPKYGSNGMFRIPEFGPTGCWRPTACAVHVITGATFSEDAMAGLINESFLAIILRYTICTTPQEIKNI